MPSPLRVSDDRMHGFHVARPVPVPELQATAFRAEHARTGLQVFCLEAADPENLLAVCLPTWPADDTGLPHIAEHVVLGGSRSYPLRDPFVELLKGSMATFANAMTYADRTLFPVASNVAADFRNLARVYLDAVFHPLVRRESFAQEGHALFPGDPRDPAAGLREQGIVHSEMHGAYAELDTVAQAAILADVLAGTPYQYDSGGVPAAIATLDHGRLLAFCREHYRPERALVFLYGDLGHAAGLELLAEALADLPAADGPRACSLPPSPRPWTAPRERRLPVSVGPDEDPADRQAVVLTWYTGVFDQVADSMALDFLDHLLLGNPGAPLRKALEESGLGDDLFLAGFDSERRETLFQVGLRGCPSRKRHAFQRLVLDTLAGLAEQGVPAPAVLAALNQMEFTRRLVDGHYAISLAEDVFGVWVYGIDPLQALCLEEPLRRLRQRLTTDPSYLPGLLRRTFLDNPHRLLLACVPDPALADQERNRAAAALAAANQALSPEERRCLWREAEDLRRWQETPDSPADLARLPRLAPRDIPRHPPQLLTETEPCGRAVLLANRTFTNGIEDCMQVFELPALPTDLLDYLPLFAYCLGRLGTATCDYAALAGRIALLGGGMGGLCLVRRSGPAALAPPVPALGFRWSALETEFPAALDLVQDILRTTRFAPGERLADLLRQRRSRMLSGVLGDGHLWAAQQAAACLSPVHNLRNRWHGPPQLRLIDDLVDRLPESLDEVARILERIRGQVLAAGSTVLSHTGSARFGDALHRHLADFACSPATAPVPAATAEAVAGTALTIPAHGAHVAWCLPAPLFSAAEAPLIELGAHLLSLGAAWEEVRAKGGAYGASCEYDSLHGSLCFLSYRDPDPGRTLGVFADLVREGGARPWPEREIAEALPAVVRNDQRPLRPAQLTETALHHHLHGISYEQRDEFRRRLLRATPADVAAALRATFAAGSAWSGICVVGDEELLASMRPPLPLDLSPLLPGSSCFVDEGE